MTLRKELERLAGTYRELPVEECERLADLFNVDTHEIAFLYDAALAGKLHLVRGLNIDREVDDAD